LDTVGGRARIHSSPGAGTRITGEVVLEPEQLSTTWLGARQRSRGCDVVQRWVDAHGRLVVGAALGLWGVGLLAFFSL
jgi:hypothetical protein